MTDQLTKYLSKVKARTEKVSDWRSDDFGRNCHSALKVAADDIAKLTEICEVLRAACLLIYKKDPCPDYLATRALGQARRIASGEEGK